MFIDRPTVATSVATVVVNTICIPCNEVSLL